MSILFAIVFLVVIFKCVGLVLGVCGKLLGAVLSLFGFIYRCRSNRIRNFHGICIGAVMHRGGMAVDQADILKIVCSEWTQKV